MARYNNNFLAQYGTRRRGERPLSTWIDPRGRNKKQRGKMLNSDRFDGLREATAAPAQFRNHLATLGHSIKDVQAGAIWRKRKVS